MSKQLKNDIKNSIIKTPWHIIRFLSFFSVLLPLCLPVLWAGHKNVSLITFIASIVNHGFDIKAICADKSYLFAICTVISVIIFSIVEIICSLFTQMKNGYKRNITAFSINFFALALTAFLSIGFGAKAKIGLIIIFLIYLVKLILHNKVDKKEIKPYQGLLFVLIIASIIASLCFSYHTQDVKYTAPKSKENDLSVVTFNVAAAFGSKLDDTDSMTRSSRFANYMNDIKPDLIGTQEMNSYWLNNLKTGLGDYESYGIKRGGDSEEKNSEMNALFWNKSRFSLIEKNTFWLSETPQKQSKYTYTDENGNKGEAGCYRICSFVVLFDKKTEQKLIFLNTHLDNASEQAANFGAKVIIDKTNELKSKYGNKVHIVLTGDFNETQNNTAYKLVKDKLNDCTDSSKKTATYQEWGYRSTQNEPIDFIFTSGKGYDYTVLNNLNGGYISDHYGVYSNINF